MDKIVPETVTYSGIRGELIIETTDPVSEVFGEFDKVFPIYLDLTRCADWTMRGLPDSGCVAAEVEGDNVRFVNSKGEAVVLQFRG